MKVGELIYALQQMPEDAEVVNTKDKPVVPKMVSGMVVVLVEKDIADVEDTAWEMLKQSCERKVA